MPRRWRTLVQGMLLASLLAAPALARPQAPEPGAAPAEWAAPTDPAPPAQPVEPPPGADRPAGPPAAMPRVSPEPYLGLGGMDRVFTLSAKLGFRVDRLRLSWLWREGFYDHQLRGYSENVRGARADWILWDRPALGPGLALYAGAGLLAVKHADDVGPVRHGYAAVGGVGLAFASHTLLPLATIGLDLQVPLGPGAGPSPVVLLDVSVSPVLVLAAVVCGAAKVACH